MAGSRTSGGDDILYARYYARVCYPGKPSDADDEN